MCYSKEKDILDVRKFFVEDERANIAMRSCKKTQMTDSSKIPEPVAVANLCALAGGPMKRGAGFNGRAGQGVVGKHRRGARKEKDRVETILSIANGRHPRNPKADNGIASNRGEWTELRHKIIFDWPGSMEILFTYSNLEAVAKRRLIPFVLAIIGFSILVFLIEEYVEDNDYDGDFSLRVPIQNPAEQGPIPSPASVDECYKYESFVILDKCLPCTDFEAKAIKTKHCIRTGFYDRINCTKSNHVALKPCLKVNTTPFFYKFVTFNGILTLLSFFVALKRREYLDSRAYHRVQQQFA
ncbi:unnamed protein product, partial [Mesorhabditis spiculigera]